ncbi:MAG: hypothetical protein K5773_08250 [Pseudobutyrivibrio sp.]|nr:hypothetical protein [Pseudobutyrivibrio sp.]
MIDLRINNKRLEFIDKLVYVIFLANVFSYSFMYRILDSRQVYLVMFPIVIYWLLRRKTSPFDIEYLFLQLAFFLGGILMQITAPNMNWLWNVMVFSFIFPIAYLLGKMCVGEDSTQSEKRAFTALNVVAAGMFATYILDYAKKYLTVGFHFKDVFLSFIDEEYSQKVAPKLVEWVNFWNPEPVVKNEADFGAYVVIGTLFFAFLNRKEKKKFFWLIVIAETIMVFNSVMAIGRSTVIQLVLVNGILLVTYLLSHVSDGKKVYKILIPVGTAIIFFALIFGFNIFHIRDLYENSFLSRNGGIFNNIRFKWEREGYYNLFTIQKGVWNVQSHPQGKTHNTWLEYGRNYDVIFYIFLMFFVVFSLIKSLLYFFKRKEKKTVMYYAFGMQLCYFLYFYVERMGFPEKDWIIIYIFVSGIAAGISHAKSIGEINVANNVVSLKNKKYIDLGLLYLSFSLIAICYYDWWYDKLRLYMVLVAPIGCYLLMSFLSRSKIADGILAAMGIASLLLAGYTYTHSDEFLGIGFVKEPFSHNPVTKDYLIILCLIPLALVLGLIMSKFKLNKCWAVVIGTIASLYLFRSQMFDGRVVTIKEALKLAFTYNKGEAWGPIGLTTSDINTSYNSWLNYSRDYGLIMFILMMAFLCWTLWRFIQFIREAEPKGFDYMLILAYIFMMVGFSFTDFAYDYKYMLIAFLIICGGINNRLTINNQFLHNGHTINNDC